ncbi:MAG TPA: hypothetical protein VI916_05050, partial [Acidimicrobiia bacterium]|nr:hypothetical protein [Acidimicrobiia bacterium]
MTGVAGDRAPGRVRDDILAVAAGVVGASVLRDGAFATGDAVVFPLALAVLALVGRCRVEARWRPMVVAVAALSVWWFVAAAGWGDLADATPLLGGFVGFAAAAVLAANLAPDQHAQLRSSLVVGAAGFAAAGLVGLALRSDALASRAQGLWRLSGTLTYANAAGLLLAMLLPLAIAERGRAGSPRWTGSAVAVIAAGLAASMSRGAAVALLVALPLIWRSLRSSWWPLALGAVAGVVAVATASSGANQPVVIGVALAAALLASLPAPDWRAACAGAVAVGAMLAAVPSIRSGIGDVVDRRLALSQFDDRTPEWRGAF